MELFIFYPSLVLVFLKESEFYSKFKIKISNFILHNSLHSGRASVHCAMVTLLITVSEAIKPFLVQISAPQLVYQTLFCLCHGAYNRALAANRKD